MKSFLSDRARISPPASPLHLSAEVGAFNPGIVAPPRAQHGEHAAPPQIECVREGDRIARLVITCGCGERIEIDCLYPPGK
jgi:hypothetical protein